VVTNAEVQGGNVHHHLVDISDQRDGPLYGEQVMRKEGELAQKKSAKSDSTTRYPQRRRQAQGGKKAQPRQRRKKREQPGYQCKASKGGGEKRTETRGKRIRKWRLGVKL